jgi:hypothetical protein
MSIARLASASLLALGLAGCFAPTSATQRLSDAAIDMNTAARFGRMDIAVEYVAVAAREEFARRHAGWGKRVRIVDIEFGGMDLKEKDEAEVFVNVTWQRPDDAIIRETRITQRWKDVRGTWGVIAESAEGDAGIFGERPKPAAKPGASAGPQPQALPVEIASPPPPRSSSYRTRTIHDQ